MGAAAGGSALAIGGTAVARPSSPPRVCGNILHGTTTSATISVALAFAAAAADTAVHRTRASNFYEFLNDPASDLRDLNGDTSQFTALVSVPDSPKVKLVYGLGIVFTRCTLDMGHFSLLQQFSRSCYSSFYGRGDWIQPFNLLDNYRKD